MGALRSSLEAWSLLNARYPGIQRGWHTKRGNSVHLIRKVSFLLYWSLTLPVVLIKHDATSTIMIMMIVFLCAIQMSTRVMKESEKWVKSGCEGKTTQAATKSGQSKTINLVNQSIHILEPTALPMAIASLVGTHKARTDCSD